MIGALADASRGARRAVVAHAAEKAFDYVERVLVSDGRVARLAKGDIVKAAGFSTTTLRPAAAALDLYEAPGHERYLESARLIADRTIERFWDQARARSSFPAMANC